MGIVADFDHLPRVSPLVAANGGVAAPGMPPKGGVQNLVFSENPDGSRSMDYTYKGEEYYIRYTPSGTPGCYNFSTRTVTNEGNELTGEYCR
jgi:hypothetical protein